MTMSTDDIGVLVAVCSAIGSGAASYAAVSVRLALAQAAAAEAQRRADAIGHKLDEHIVWHMTQSGPQ